MSNQACIIFLGKFFDYEVLHDIASKNLDIKKNLVCSLYQKE